MQGQSSSKSYAVLPLPAKVAAKGHGAGAESFLEVVQAVHSKLKPGQHIASADGSKALQKAASHSGVPSLTGVSHLRFVFTPLATLPKAGMSQNYVDMLRRMTKDGIAKERRNCFVLAAGDNVAEAIAAVSKKQLRRMGLLATSARDAIEHRNVLCAHYLNKEPGLVRVLRALALHRERASSGLVSPKDAFKQPLWDV
eukprot:Skav230700  [mRNA]  locus=scaffold1495:147698:148291:+ [translate_table: standard]